MEMSKHIAIHTVNASTFLKAFSAEAKQFTLSSVQSVQQSI